LPFAVLSKQKRSAEMAPQLYLATQYGLVTAAWDGTNWRVLNAARADTAFTSVIAREGVVLAGTKGGILRSDDSGQTWQAANTGLTTSHVRWLAYHPAHSDFELAGVEPAGIFISRDGAHTWREAPEVPLLRQKHNWFLPYAPAAGCVRGFAIHGSRLYAAVEVGGVLRSDDNGRSWSLAPGSDGSPNLDGPPEPMIYPDVHSIEVHPTSLDLVYAPTGGGFYTSSDGGATWLCRYSCYVRAVWVDPADSQHLILGPASGVDTGGRIEQSHDGGQSWTPASNGLQTPWRRNMVERFLQVGEQLLAILSNGQLLTASLAALDWKPILPEVPGVNAVACIR
jgi:hypothetical protein